MSYFLVRLFSEEVKYSERTPIDIRGTAEHFCIGAQGVESYESGQGRTIMVIARGEFIYELEKNMEFRQRHAERERVRREKEEAARKFVEEYNRIIGEAAKETEIAIDKKLTEMGLRSAGDIDELKFQVIYEMPTGYGVVTNNPDKKDGGSRTSNYTKLMKDVVNILAPKYQSQGWSLTHRHIKGGIFIFTIE